MASTSYQFQVGDIRCLAVTDGTHTYPTSAFVANVPVERFEEELQARALPSHEYVSPYTSLFIDTGRHRVLVDTGAGFAPTNGQLRANLAAAGIDATDVDTVILTHGHADHIGGTTDATGQIAFPNARYLMWRAEWEFWNQDNPNLTTMGVDDHLRQILVASAHAKLPPIQPHLELLEREVEIVPGIRAIPAPGHTRGHLALSISSGDAQVLHLADAVLHPILMEHPDWTSPFDLLADEAVATRRLLLDRAATDRATVHAFHFPFPGVGHVAPEGAGWRWYPVESATS
jgi:glyoxylase-like metal-dependent hydrolase (beta-lactamase superfamily II)